MGHTIDRCINGGASQGACARTRGFSGLSCLWRVVLSIMLSGQGEKPDRLQFETANAKLGRAIAKAQSSLAAECKTILNLHSRIATNLRMHTTCVIPYLSHGQSLISSLNCASNNGTYKTWRKWTCCLHLQYYHQIP